LIFDRRLSTIATCMLMFLFLIPLQNKEEKNHTVLEQLVGWPDVAVEVLCLGLEGALRHEAHSINIDGPALEFQRVQPITPSIPSWK
jgi:hypothetical protein